MSMASFQERSQTTLRVTETIVDTTRNPKKVHWAIEECVVIPITPRSVQTLSNPFSEIDVLTTALVAIGRNDNANESFAEVEIQRSASAATSHTENMHEVAEAMVNVNDDVLASASSDDDTHVNVGKVIGSCFQDDSSIQFQSNIF